MLTNTASDTVNGVVAPFGGSVPQTFPYSNEEEANVGQVAQNGVSVATVFVGAKVPYIKGVTTILTVGDYV